MSDFSPCKHAGEETTLAARNAHARRPTTKPGPRCASCHRKIRRERKAKARAAHLARVYGLSQADVEAIIATMPVNAAGVPVCPGCLVATGASKALAADHDHERERLGMEIRETVRGFLCSTDNQVLGLGVERLQRLIDYARNPPAYDALGTR